MQRGEGARIAVLPGYDDPRTPLRACAITWRLVACRPPHAARRPVIAVTNTTLAMGGGAAPLQIKRVPVTYTHNYMFVGPIISLIGGGTFSTNVPITTVAVMRKEL